MCVEAHLRDLLEQGFKVVVAREATPAQRHPEWGYGYTAALIKLLSRTRRSADERSREGDEITAGKQGLQNGGT
jgi:nicotinamidase-related amidase